MFLPKVHSLFPLSPISSSCDYIYAYSFLPGLFPSFSSVTFVLSNYLALSLAFIVSLYLLIFFVPLLSLSSFYPFPSFLFSIFHCYAFFFFLLLASFSWSHPPFSFFPHLFTLSSQSLICIIQYFLSSFHPSSPLRSPFMVSLPISFHFFSYSYFFPSSFPRGVARRLTRNSHH